MHVKDGGNLKEPKDHKDAVQFGFNVWTVLDEVMNPNAEWSEEEGFRMEDAFAGEGSYGCRSPSVSTAWSRWSMRRW